VCDKPRSNILNLDILFTRLYPLLEKYTRVSVRLSVRVNAKISETIKARKLGLGMQILEVLAQRNFIYNIIYAQYNAHNAET